MIKTKYFVALLATTTLACTASGAEWDNPADIPAIEPVVVGLAGEQPADIVRYLMARGALQTRISPDGSTVAFSYRVTGEPQLWVVDAAGGWPRQLTFGSGITQFRWSPDGERLIYLSASDGDTQVWARWMDSGQTAQLTRTTRPPRGLAWSPDGTRIAFSMFVPRKSRPLVELPDRPGGAGRGRPARVGPPPQGARALWPRRRSSSWVGSPRSSPRRPSAPRRWSSAATCFAIAWSSSTRRGAGTSGMTPRRCLVRLPADARLKTP